MGQTVPFQKFHSRKGSASRLLSATALTAAGIVMLSGPALANNWGDHQGEGITVDTSIPNTTNIEQTLDRVTVRGDGDIDAGWTVNLAQPSNKSKYILYDIEGDPTEIRGNLNANGEVYIFDQNGVIFGENSRVDVGSLVASTGYISDEDFARNDGKLTFRDVKDGKIELKGSITVADAGLAGFVAPTIVNSGTINARMGKVVMASGEKVTLDLYGDSLVEIALNDKLSDALIENTGTINAQGGTVVVKAEAAKEIVKDIINMNGVVNASSATMQGGKIVLGGGSQGVVKVAGKLDASGTKGGDIKITGQNVWATSTSDINADGGIGTDGIGAGGSAILFADEQGMYEGAITARGGALGGDGGFIETSGLNVGVTDTAYVTAEAYNGLSGTWLLDPLSIIIESGVTGGNTNFFFQNYTKVGTTTINSALNTGTNVTIATGVNSTSGGAGANNEGDIRVRSSITKTAGGNATLTLIANDDIKVENNADITSSSGKLNVILTANGADTDILDLPDGITIASGSDINTRGGNVLFTTPKAIAVNGTINAAGGNINLDNGGIFSGAANSLKTSGTGVIALRQNGGFLLGVGGSIQNAIDALDNIGTGLNIITVGSGLFAQTVNADENNLFFRGANFGIAGDGVRGAETNVGIGTNGFNITGNNVTVNGFQIGLVTGAGVQVSGDGAVVRNNVIGLAGGNGINVDGADNVRIGGNAIGAVLGDGIALNDTTNSFIWENTINGALGNGVAVYGSDPALSSNLKIYDNDIDQAGQNGIFVDPSSNVLLSGNVISNSAIDGINAVSTLGLRIMGNQITFSGDDGIDIFDSAGVIIGNNSVLDTGLNTGTGDGIKLDQTSYSSIDTNVVGRVADNAIEAINGAFALIANNSIGPAGSNGIYIDNISTLGIHANVISLVSAAGMLIDNVSTFLIQDNFIGAVGTDGISISNATNGSVDNNDVMGAVNGDGIFARILNNVTFLTNYVLNAGDDGIDIADSGLIDISYNLFEGPAGSGIEAARINDLNIEYNLVRNAGADGVNLNDVQTLNLSNNAVIGAAEDGFDLSNIFFADIKNNQIFSIIEDGIFINTGGNVDVDGNIIFGTRDDGIDINSVSIADVSNNRVTNSLGNGIKGDLLSDGTFDGNIITNILNDGIQLSNLTGTNSIQGNRLNITGDDGIDMNGVISATIAGNTITNAGDDGIYAGMLTQSVIQSNSVDNAVNNGLHIEAGDAVDIADNTITDSGINGLFISGGLNGGIAIAGNTFTGNTTGMRIESGEIDLTGDTNSINGGIDGIVFDRFAGTAPLSLVAGLGDTPGTSGTFGTTIFTGQSGYYIALMNNAFSNGLDDPLFLDVTNSTFDGFSPNSLERDINGVPIMTQAQIDSLESKFQHYNDLNTIGLLLYGALPIEIDQNDILRYFDATNLQISGLNVTVLGLPQIPGAPASFNSITPFAGGEVTAEGLSNIATAAGGNAPATGGSVSSASLNNIDTAAGSGQSTSCWDSAMGMAQSGQAANFNYVASTEDTLNSAATCGAGI